MVIGIVWLSSMWHWCDRRHHVVVVRGVVLDVVQTRCGCCQSGVVVIIRGMVDVSVALLLLSGGHCQSGAVVDIDMAWLMWRTSRRHGRHVVVVNVAWCSTWCSRMVVIEVGWCSMWCCCGGGGRSGVVMIVRGVVVVVQRQGVSWEMGSRGTHLNTGLNPAHIS